MNNSNNNFEKFLNDNIDENFTENDSNFEKIKNKDGLIEKKLINKKLIIEDGRELLKEELPITHSKKTYII